MIAVTLLLLSTTLWDQGFDAVKAEPVLEKRAQRAIDWAGTRLTEIRAAYDKGDYKQLKPAMGEVAEAAEFCLATLEAMGKHPAKNVKNYKLSEKRMRELLRRVTTFRADVGFDDRASVEPAEARINAVHEKLLAGALSRKP